jgi:hypothetical protein
MNLFLVFFTDDAPLQRLGIETEQLQPTGQTPTRYLTCKSVSGTDLGFVRLVREAQSPPQKEVVLHLPNSWVLCMCEGDLQQPFGFRVTPG